MSNKHTSSTDPIPSRSRYLKEIIDAGMYAHRPINNLERVSAHVGDGELRPGSHSNWSQHTGFIDCRSSGGMRGGAQLDLTHSILVRATPRSSANRSHISIPESMLLYAGLDSHNGAA